MSENKEDLNNGQSVAGSDLNSAQPVTGQDLQPTGQGKLADGTDENKTVPYSELKKAIDEKNAAEQRIREQEELYRSQMAMAQANQPVQPQQPLSDYDQAKADLGLAGEEFLDEGQRSKVFARMTEIMNIRNQQATITLANQQFEATHPDFSSVVGLRNPVTGQIQPSAEILKILTEKPYLTAAAGASSQGAYEIVMQQRQIDKLRQENAVNQEHLQQQNIDNTLAPVSGAAAAGGAVTTTGGSITVEQQLEMERRVAAGEFQKG